MKKKTKKFKFKIIKKNIDFEAAVSQKNKTVYLREEAIFCGGIV